MKFLIITAFMVLTSALFAEEASSKFPDTLVSFSVLETWKVFQWVKDGTAQITDTDGERVLKMSAKSDGRGIHYYLERDIPVNNGRKLEVSFEWRARVYAGAKAYFSSGFYMHDVDGKYINAAISAGGSSFTTQTMTPWKGFIRTVGIPTDIKDKKLKFVRFFFSLTAGGELEIKNILVKTGK